MVGQPVDDVVASALVGDAGVHEQDVRREPEPCDSAAKVAFPEVICIAAQ